MITTCKKFTRFVAYEWIAMHEILQYFNIIKSDRLNFFESI
jgi:hypothetical protein